MVAYEEYHLVRGLALKFYLNGRQTVIQMYGKDLKPGTWVAIKKQQGLKD